MDTITQNDITPVWDQVDAVKYLTWDDRYWARLVYSTLVDL